MKEDFWDNGEYFINTSKNAKKILISHIKATPQ